MTTTRLTGEALRRRFQAEAARLHVPFLHLTDPKGQQPYDGQPGFPDLLVVTEAGCFFVEFKSVREKLSASQCWWGSALKLLAGAQVRYRVVNNANAAAVARELGWLALARDLAVETDPHAVAGSQEGGDSQTALPAGPGATSSKDGDLIRRAAAVGLCAADYAPTQLRSAVEQLEAAALRRGDR